MRIRSIKIENFRLFEDLEVEFPDSKTILLIGKNGSGKSTILDAIGISLNQFISGIILKDSDFYDIKSIEKDDILLNKKNVLILSDLFYSNDIGEIRLDTNIEKDFVNEPTEFLNQKTRQEIKRKLSKSDRENIPIIAYYRIDRKFSQSVKDTDFFNTNSLLYAYVNALGNNKSTFASFEDWFLYEEDRENQFKIQNDDIKYQLPTLHTVRTAITQFLNQFEKFNYSNLRGYREELHLTGLYKDVKNANTYLTIQKDGQRLKLNTLSSGEKMLLYLVADIARRLSIANTSNDRINGEGLVLIDEIDLHLHPKWQRQVIPALNATFPNIQFICTSHSPQVISSVEGKDILVLEDGKVYPADINPKGRDSNGILEELMGADKRPPQVDDLIDSIITEISTSTNGLGGIQQQLILLKEKVAEDDPILLRIENLIRRKQILSQ